MGVIVKDDKFYALAQEGATIRMDKEKRQLTVNNEYTVPFELSRMEQVLIEGGGVTELYKKYSLIVCFDKN